MLRIKWITGLMIAAIFFSAKVEAGEKNVLNIVENDWPPFYFAGQKDGPAGIAGEIMEMCIPETGYTFEFNFYPVKRMYAYLKSGKIDIALFSYKKEREEFVIYGGEPLFGSGYRPVVKANSDIKIDSLADFDKLKIGHLAGLKYSPEFLDYIDRRSGKGDLIIATTGDSPLRMLLAGIIDVFVDTRETTLWRAKQLGVLDRIRIVDYDIRTRQYFITTSKASNRIEDKKAFLNRFDECLRRAKSDGRYNDIVKKYGWE